MDKLVRRLKRRLSLRISKPLVWVLDRLPERHTTRAENAQVHYLGFSEWRKPKSAKTEKVN